MYRNGDFAALAASPAWHRQAPVTEGMREVVCSKWGWSVREAQMHSIEGPTTNKELAVKGREQLLPRDRNSCPSEQRFRDPAWKEMLRAAHVRYFITAHVRVGLR